MDLLKRSTRQLTHDSMVNAVAVVLRKQYADVRADAPGYTPPGRIFWTGTDEGHVPDVMAGPYVIEVETADSLGIDHTKSQCELFSAFATQKGLRFVVVVPSGYKSAMELWLRLWQAPGSVWEV